MRSMSKSWVLLLTLFFFIGIGKLDAQSAEPNAESRDPEGLIIEKITPHYGSKLRHWEPLKFFNTITSKVGEPFSWKKSSDDLAALEATNLFVDAELHAEVVGGKVLLRYDIIENLYLSGVEFEGLSAIKREEVDAVISDDLTYYFSRPAFERSIRALESLYHSKGYIFAHVSRASL